MNKTNDEFIDLLNWLEDQGMLPKETVEGVSESLLNDQENTWDRVRKSFFPNNEIKFNAEPMNAANLCPTWNDSLTLIHAYRCNFNQDISIQFRRRLFSTIFQTIKKNAAENIGADPKNIALVRNTSEGNNQLSRGFKNWGDREVVLWDENHPTNKFVWEARSPNADQVKVFSVKEVDFTQPDADVRKDIIHEIITKLTEKTAILSFSDVSNVSAIRMPTKDIIKAVRAHEINVFKRPESIIHIHVDGAVSWGATYINVAETDCDSFASSSHKWMMGPFETGIFYMKSEKVTNFDISIHGYDGNIDFHTDLPNNTSRFEQLGQRDEANLIGLGAAILKNKLLNPVVIERRILELQGIFRGQLDAVVRKYSYTIKYATPKSAAFSSGVTIFQLINASGKAINHAALNTFLYAEGRGFAVADTAKANQLRVCTHIMNLESNIRALVTRIDEYLEELSKIINEVQSSESESMKWPNNPYSTRS